MRSKFDEQLKKLNEEMMHMGSMIEESIQKAIEAFIHQDADSAKAIMEGDSEIDREQKKIESLSFNLLMQQQPVARDLRTISAAMKMVTDMERIGDHAADISEMTILMSSDKPYRVNIEHVKSMASETMLMLIRAIEAYVEKNNDKAHIVMKQDDVVDDLFDKVKAELIDFIREHPEDGEQAEDLLMVAKYFAELCIAMFLTGIEIQTPADFISKSTIIILQNFCLPTYLFFALQIIYQRLSHNLIAIRQ